MSADTDKSIRSQGGREPAVVCFCACLSIVSPFGPAGQLNQAADQVKALLEAADISTRDLTLLRGEHQQLQSCKELSDQHADRISAAHSALQTLHAGVAESLAVLQGKSQELQVGFFSQTKHLWDC